MNGTRRPILTASNNAPSAMPQRRSDPSIRSRLVRMYQSIAISFTSPPLFPTADGQWPGPRSRPRRSPASRRLLSVYHPVANGRHSRGACEMVVNGSFYFGNAAVDQVRGTGWFVGQFVPPEIGLRHQTDVELKWAIHPDGDRRAN